jgi:hypothetical protein
MAVTAAVSSCAAATLAAQVVKSPAQAAADSAPPPPSLLSAEVEHRVLSDSIVLRGTVIAGQMVDVTPVVEGEGIRSALVSRLPVGTGTTLAPGQLIVEVSGRPVFVLPGALPSYRDLTEGARGDDVAQLQAALVELGHGTGDDRPGAFGPGTTEALAAFYAGIGYEPLTAPVGGEPEAGDAAAGSAMLPAGEVVYLADFPARVDRATTVVGAEVSGPVLTLSAGELRVTGSLQPHHRDLVRTGQTVRIHSELSGDTAEARVDVVAEAMDMEAPSEYGVVPEGFGDGAAPGYAVSVIPTEPLDSGWAGQDVRLTMEAATTGEPVLVVPVSAISARADGEVFVQVLEPDGSQRDVRVTTGVTGDGSVEVRSADGDHGLSVGDDVVIGTNAGAAR